MQPNAASTSALWASPTIGRSGDFSRLLTEASLLTPTTRISPKAFGRLQIARMADVQEIEAAVGKDDPFLLYPGLVEEREQLCCWS